ncbi:methyltransferase domain-containing protein [Azospirillum soli]|uniref:methyltransferase domain-containing protein n=1 Tax=Azospirillum soli TaxID=1304799 RepID=UPI001AE6F571|nr:methyltransferase domain-containing protein [Azospirillum soli]MBP2313919.1 SAM-dependent methyltransferase [Azospirillum soli]
MPSPSTDRHPTAPPFQRLRLGAVCPDAGLPPLFDGESWTHLGDPSYRPVEPLWRRVAGLLRRPSPAAGVRFQPWVYRKGDRLPFEDGAFSLVVTEDYLQRLFFDETLALLRECRRVLRVGGVLRVAVPDADLRTYARPEPPGYPDRRMPFTHPAKHRTRWSVYMLAETLTLAGLQPVPLVYCTRDGAFQDAVPGFRTAGYEGVADPLVFTLDCVRNRRALIVDGVRR